MNFRLPHQAAFTLTIKFHSGYLLSIRYPSIILTLAFI